MHPHKFELFWCTWYLFEIQRNPESIAITIFHQKVSWNYALRMFLNIYVALYCCVITQKLDMNNLCSFISAVPKPKFTGKEWLFPLQWQHSHLVTRIHEGSEKSAVAGYCLHHPGHPHRREPAVQLVMFFVLHVLIFMSGFKIRYYAWWILTRPLAPFHALCIG